MYTEAITYSGDSKITNQSISSQPLLGLTLTSVVLDISNNQFA